MIRAVSCVALFLILVAPGFGAVPCPSRALRTEQFLCIRNYEAPEDSAAMRRAMLNGDRVHRHLTSGGLPTGAFNLVAWQQRTNVKSGEAVPALELYDLQKDPHCRMNLAIDPKHRMKLWEMQRDLDADLIRANDPRNRIPGYVNRSIQGWPVRISEALLRENPDQTANAIRLLEDQMQIAMDALPAEPLRELRNVPIWLSPAYPNTGPHGEYHPGAGWLQSEGRRPELVRCVELTNTSIMEAEIRRMPVMLLHELAHAYHHQVLDFDNPRVIALYDQAVAAGIYESVQRGQRGKEKAYAITNPREYFAECSEALFGTNDFYPFNRRELQEHDPRMHALLFELWKVDTQ
ncbi:MAG: hypothetical protein KDA96_09385 [Planctomycetaceae bacterium]|nr:hypothetical protein [Planctomycetaceae bacterium]